MKKFELKSFIPRRVLQLWFRLYLHLRLSRIFKKNEFQNSENLKHDFFLVDTTIYLMVGTQENLHFLGGFQIHSRKSELPWQFVKTLKEMCNYLDGSD